MQLKADVKSGADAADIPASWPAAYKEYSYNL